MGKVKAKITVSWSVLEFVLVVILIVLACLLPMAGIARGIALLREGAPRAARDVVIGEMVIGLILGAMGTYLLGDVVEADTRERLNLWGCLFGLLVLLSVFYSWQFFYSPRARRLRNADGLRQWRRAEKEGDDCRDVDTYMERLKEERARWKKDGGVRKPKGIEKVERTGWVRNMEGEDTEEVWRVETEFKENDGEEDVGEEDRDERGKC